MEQSEHQSDTWPLRLARLGILASVTPSGSVDRERAFAARDQLQQLLDEAHSNESTRQATNEAFRCVLQQVQQGMHAATAAAPSLLQQVCEEIRVKGESERLEEALALVLHLQATGAVDDEADAALLEDIRGWLGVGKAAARRIGSDRVQAAAAQRDEQERLVGLEPHWSIDRKLKHIRAEYRKWHGRVTLPDKDRRAEAERRLQTLAQLRSRLDAQQAQVAT